MAVRSMILVWFALWSWSDPAGAKEPAGAAELACPTPSGDLEVNKSEGRRYFKMGNTHFKMGEHRKSAAAFACVLKLVPYSLKARFQLGLSYEKLKRYTEARAQYEWLLADTSEEAQPLHPAVRTHLSAIRGKTDDPEPLPGPAVDRGWDLKRRWWFWTAVGAATVFTGVATFTGLQALEYRDRWERDWRTSDRESLDRYKDLTDLALGGVVLSAVALGVTLYLTRPRAAETAAVTPATVGGGRVTLLPSCGPEGCMLTFSVGF